MFVNFAVGFITKAQVVRKLGLNLVPCLMICRTILYVLNVPETKKHFPPLRRSILNYNKRKAVG